MPACLALDQHVPIELHPQITIFPLPLPVNFIWTEWQALSGGTILGEPVLKSWPVSRRSLRTSLSSMEMVAQPETKTALSTVEEASNLYGHRGFSPMHQLLPIVLEKLHPLLPLQRKGKPCDLEPVPCAV